MTCKDCVHYEVCKEVVVFHHGRAEDLEVDGVEKHCEYFKPKSRFVELPCEVGDFVYVIYGREIQSTKVFSMKIESENEHYMFYCKCMVHQGGARFETFVFGKTVFLSREEAEKALSERSK